MNTNYFLTPSFITANMSIMAGHTSSKINLLLRNWPRDTVAVSPWLEEQGVYRQLLEAYQKSEWVERIGHGAFIRVGDKVDWTGALYAIQEQLKLPIHVGGKTSLELSGYSQNIPLGEGRSIFLFGPTGQRLPKWFDMFDWKVNVHYTMTSLFRSQKEIGLTSTLIKDHHIKLSSPERAIMEMLYFVTTVGTFNEAASFMESLTAATLRPQLVQNLLETCRSVKVKRLFMYLAELNDFDWIKKIELSQIDLGRGKRLIVKNGCYDAKYKITVPAIQKPDKSEEI